MTKAKMAKAFNPWNKHQIGLSPFHDPRMMFDMYGGGKGGSKGMSQRNAEIVVECFAIKIGAAQHPMYNRSQHSRGDLFIVRNFSYLFRDLITEHKKVIANGQTPSPMLGKSDMYDIGTDYINNILYFDSKRAIEEHIMSHYEFYSRFKDVMDLQIETMMLKPVKSSSFDEQFEIVKAQRDYANSAPAEKKRQEKLNRLQSEIAKLTDESEAYRKTVTKP